MGYFETYPEVLRAVERAANMLEEMRYAGWRPNERQTRFALIDPVLRALGWEGVNPAECFIEWDFGRYGRDDDIGNNKRVDYALFLDQELAKVCSGDAPPVALIEAKRWGEPLDGAFEQLNEYMSLPPRLGIKPVGIVTNGEIWRTYPVESWGAIRQSWAFDVSVSEQTAESVAASLWWDLAKEEYRRVADLPLIDNNKECLLR